MPRAIPLLLLLTALLGAEDAAAPRIFFRTPDRETERDIRKLISHEGIGSGTRGSRAEARADLREIGRWAVPYLTKAIAGRRRLRDVRTPMNAVMVLARIGDPRCVPALHEVARKNRSPDVRKTACLALGIFGEQPKYPGTIRLLGELLREEDPKHKHQRAAALALGKIPHRDATATLVGEAAKVGKLAQSPNRRHTASAILLAAVVRSPEVELPEYLSHREKLLRRTAATCLLIRPLPSAQAERLLDILKRPSKEEKLRAVRFHALGRMARTEAIRERLLDCARRTSEEEDARVAAIIELACEWNVRSNFETLKRAWRPLSDRNDPVAAALLFAMVRSGEREAVELLLRVVQRGSDHMRFYAAGSLLHWAFLSRTDELQPLAELDEVYRAVANLRHSRDAGLKDLALLADAVKHKHSDDLEKRAELARERLREIRGPYGLHLWDWTPGDRAWAMVNDLVREILELDDIADRGNPFERAEEGPLKGERVGRDVTGTPEEQDLIEFLREEPYFGPEDLGGS